MRRAMRGMARLYAEPIIWWMLRTVFGANPFGFFLASMRSTRPPSNRDVYKRQVHALPAHTDALRAVAAIAEV